MQVPPRRRVAPPTVLVALALSAPFVSSCGSGRAGAPVATSANPTSTLPAALPTSTSTTADPGTLPQTAQLPSPTDPAFQQRISDLWSAILSGEPAKALPAFFPLGAYIQVKAISDPEHDYQTRLIADFERDIMSLHAQVGPSATFGSVSVPGTARWIVPGVEYNKGSYWRVYGTRVTYDVSGQARSFIIASMISWRGEWYVVHLLSIR